MDKDYSKLTVKELKIKLKARGASNQGRKKDLIDRLRYYDKNDNFGNEYSSNDPVVLVKTPSPDLYKDLNLSSLTPSLSDEHILVYLKSFDKKIGSASGLYNNGFLRYIKFCVEGDIYYIKSQCKAEMHTSVNYNVDISLALDGEILECSCECVAGHSTSAHCKHVTATLFGVRDAHQKKPIITTLTSTQQLQTFHHPAKRYQGSPMRAKNMYTKKLKVVSDISLDDDDDNDDDDDADEQYINYFNNLIKSRGFNNRMAMKQLMEPANPFGVVNDHTYSNYNVENEILKSLSLTDVSKNDVIKINTSTIEQSKSSDWLEYRKVRITASKFYLCNKILNENQSKKLAQSILNPPTFSSKYTSHGSMYEKKAIELFEKYHSKKKLLVVKCGLIIMEDYPYIGASPDGLWGENSVIEVKCPYVARNLFVDENTVPYLEKNEKDELALKTDHEYYHQIQGQLMVTNRKYCNFLVYTFKSLVCIEVIRNDQFINKMRERLTIFYENYLKPAILNKYLYRDYESIFIQSSVLSKYNNKKNEDEENQIGINEIICNEKKVERQDKKPEEFKYPVLSSDMMKKVQFALASGSVDEILVEKFGLKITRKDMQTLKSFNWLNDQVINFYMNLLIIRGDLDNYPNVHAMNTFFYPKLLSSGFASLRKWTSKVDLFSKDLIIVPIHIEIHWSLAVIDLKNKQIQYYDSMGSSNDECLTALKQYMIDECLDKRKCEFDFLNWTYVNMKNIPLQHNGSDCGVYVCVFAEYICADKKLNFNNDDMPYFRNKIAYEILAENIL